LKVFSVMTFLQYKGLKIVNTGVRTGWSIGKEPTLVKEKFGKLSLLIGPYMLWFSIYGAATALQG